jgi:glycine/D-amino acid oxidase-like deaminating enzyme
MEMHLISPEEVKRMWPLMDVSDLVGASWLPTDGQASLRHHAVAGQGRAHARREDRRRRARDRLRDGGGRASPR